MEKLIEGIVKFKQSDFVQRRQLYSDLAKGQSPEVMFITCSDSRVCPSLFTHTDPGDLFVIRNAGNIVPPHAKAAGGDTASIEFAVAALGVKHIVVCGHSDCGAMKGAMNTEGLVDLPHVCDWVDHSRAAVETVRAKHGQCTMNELDKVIEENVVLQMQHLRTHPSVAARLAVGELQLHGWVYDIGHGTINAYDESHGAFIPAERCYEGQIKAAEAAA